METARSRRLGDSASAARTQNPSLAPSGDDYNANSEFIALCFSDASHDASVTTPSWLRGIGSCEQASADNYAVALVMYQGRATASRAACRFLTQRRQDSYRKDASS
jgi:hypothetical protein